MQVEKGKQTAMNNQLVFDLPRRASLAREDFFVAASNALAISVIDNWEAWEFNKAVLIGPKGAGKTHLANLWAEQVQGKICDLSTDFAGLSPANYCVDDMQNCADNPDAQEALFHFHNRIIGAGKSLLFVGRGSVRDWGITLPDLASRLGQTDLAEISSPQDDLLMAVMAKEFSDRQVQVTQPTLSYLIRNMDRSFEALHHLVDALDHASLSAGRKITRSLAAEILDNPQN